MVDCRVCYYCVGCGIIAVMVELKSRPDGVPDGSTIAGVPDGSTMVDVAGGGVSVCCCCCCHRCCHRCSVCVLARRFMTGTMQGDDDIRHNQRLVISRMLRVTTRSNTVIQCGRVHKISRIDTYGDENYYSRFPCPLMWMNVGA